MKRAHSPSRHEADRRVLTAETSSAGISAGRLDTNGEPATAPPRLLTAGAVGHQATLHTLPHDMHGLIASMLRPQDLCNLSSTSSVLANNTFSIRQETGVQILLQRKNGASGLLSLAEVNECWTIFLKLFPLISPESMTLLDGPELTKAVSRLKNSIVLMTEVRRLAEASMRCFRTHKLPEYAATEEDRADALRMQNTMADFFVTTHCLDDPDIFYSMMHLSLLFDDPRRAAIQQLYKKFGVNALAKLMARLECETCAGKGLAHKIFEGWQSWRPEPDPRLELSETQWTQLRLQAILRRATSPMAASERIWNNTNLLGRFFELSSLSGNEKHFNARILRVLLDWMAESKNAPPDFWQAPLTFIIDHARRLKKHHRCKILYYASAFFKIRISNPQDFSRIAERLSTASLENPPGNDYKLKLLAQFLTCGIKTRNALLQLIHLSRELSDELRAEFWAGINKRNFITHDRAEDRFRTKAVLDELATLPEHLHAALCSVIADLYQHENGQKMVDPLFYLPAFWQPFEAYLPENRQLALLGLSRILINAPLRTRSVLAEWLCHCVDELPGHLREAPLAAIIGIEQERVKARRTGHHSIIARSVVSLPPASKSRMMLLIEEHKQRWRTVIEEIWVPASPENTPDD